MTKDSAIEAYRRAHPEADTGGADIVLHMPRAFLWSQLAAIIGLAFAGTWFSAVTTTNLTSLNSTVGSHLKLGAHQNANDRLLKLEHTMESLVGESRATTEVLLDIRDLLNDDNSGE